MKPKNIVLSLSVLAALTIAIFISLQPDDQPLADPGGTRPPDALATQTDQGRAGLPGPPPQPDQAPSALGPQPSASEPVPLSPQVLATRRMYAAHASLRTEEVNSPDSETNRKIMHTMINKALARAQSAKSKSQ